MNVNNTNFEIFIRNKISWYKRLAASFSFFFFIFWCDRWQPVITALWLLARSVMATGIFCGYILYTTWQLSNVSVHQQQSWYIKRNTNFEVHYDDTLAWRSFNFWEFLKYFCQYLKIESAIWPEAGSIQNDDFLSSWWNDMSVRQKILWEKHQKKLPGGQLWLVVIIICQSKSALKNPR